MKTFSYINDRTETMHVYRRTDRMPSYYRMNRLLVALSLLLVCLAEKYQPWKTDGCDAFVDIILIIDSTDINVKNNDDYKKILTFSANLTDTFKLGRENSQIGAVVYSDVAKKVFDLKEFIDHRKLRKAILSLKVSNSSKIAKPYDGLDIIVDMFKPELGGRYNAGKVAVLIMSKPSDIPEYTKNSAERLQDQGVAVLVVAIGKSIWNEPVFSISNKKDVFLVENLSKLSVTKNNITTRICEGRV